MSRALPKRLRETPTGSNGRRACRYCHGDVRDPRRTSYCKRECAHEFRMRNEPQYARACVFLRDRGVCAACGLDTVAESGNVLPRGWDQPSRRYYYPVSSKRIARLGVWELDHVVELADGGDGGIENCQTLCPAHHREKTAASRRARAAARRESP